MAQDVSGATPIDENNSATMKRAQKRATSRKKRETKKDEQ